MLALKNILEIILSMHWFMIFLKRVRASFISGLILLLPLVVTVFVVNLLIEKIGGPSSRVFFGFLDTAWLDKSWAPIVLKVISIIFVIILITLFGWLSKHFLGKYILRFTEITIERLPLVKTVYKTVKQMVEAFSGTERVVFQKTVLVEFPRDGIYSIGFITNRKRSEMEDKVAKRLVTVFVPTTPNPTSGFLLLVPEEKVMELEMSVTDGIKTVISGGAVTPEYVKKNGESLTKVTQEGNLPSTVKTL